jgi:hypothetical protein
MTRQQRKELRETLTSILGNAGLAWDLAWKAAKGKTEAEALDTIDELLVSIGCQLADVRELIEEVREPERAGEAAKLIEELQRERES